MPLQRLPNWIQIGAFLLALNAGMVNVLGLFTVLHQSVSHMTGNVSMLAMSLLDWQPDHFIYLALVVICFVIGSFYSGLILGNSNVTFGHHYGFPLSLVAIFLFLTWLLLLTSLVMVFFGLALQWVFKMQWLAITKEQSFAPHICLEF
jgi:uncharacterized membrane protein YoaK (UPF0700 family)